MFGFMYLLQECGISRLVSGEAQGCTGRRSCGPGLERIVSIELALTSLLERGAEPQ